MAARIKRKPTAKKARPVTGRGTGAAKTVAKARVATPRARVLEDVVVPVASAGEGPVVMPVRRSGAALGGRVVVETPAPEAADRNGAAEWGWRRASMRDWSARVASAVRTRLWRVMAGRPAPHEPAALADVQAAIMNELAQRNHVRGESEVRTRPFQGMADMPGSLPAAPGVVAAPRARRQRLMRHLPQGRRRWVWMGVPVLLILLVIALQQGRTPAGPARVLEDIRHAVVTRDVADFERSVDVAALSTSAVNQLFGSPGLNFERLPPDMRRMLEEYLGGQPAGNGVVAGTMNGGLRARLEAYLKPGLAENLKDDLLAAVAQGSLSRGPDGLLQKLWRDAGGERLRVGEPRVTVSDAERAMAEVSLKRADLDVEIPLQLELTRLDGRWQLVDIPNLADALNRMVVADTARAARSAAQAVAELERLVTVSDVTKARTADERLLVKMRLTNTGPVDLKNLRVQVVFADAAGQPMKVVVLEEPQPLVSGASVEKAWTVPIDARRSLERYVRDLPLDALTVRAGIIGVTMPGGQRVSTENGTGGGAELVPQVSVKP